MKKKTEPVKLNKDSAFAIISPSPPGDTQYPHVLQNVLTSVCHIQLKLPSSVIDYLNLPASLTDFDYMSLMWSCFYYNLLKSEPYVPTTFNDASAQIDENISTCSEAAMESSHEIDSHASHQWSYTEHQKRQYKFHAERFYQLYKYRYKHSNITPYMSKFTDYAPYFMESLPVPINRFQTEGSEHMNYEHNCNYYSHTTRWEKWHRAIKGYFPENVATALLPDQVQIW